MWDVAKTRFVAVMLLNSVKSFQNSKDGQLVDKPIELNLILKKFHFTFDSNKLELLCRTVAVVKEELLAGLNGSLSENADAVIPVHLHDLGIAVRVDGMISKPAKTMRIPVMQKDNV